MRAWYRAIQANGGGPDYFLTLNFALQDAGKLLSLVSQQPLLEFKREPLEGEWIQSQRKTDPEFEAWVSNYASQWLANLILVYSTTLQLQRLGGGDEEHDAVEHQLLDALAQAPLTLNEWSIIGGGQMYAAVIYAEGTTWEELWAYRNAQRPLKTKRL